MPIDPEQSFDPEDIPYFFDNWCSLPWSPWVPFSATKEEFREIPYEPGVYRIRPAGEDVLMYIGETPRSLHQRLHNLRMELRNRDLMPWSDLHTEAPALWSWGDSEQYQYECSAAPLDASASGRKGMKSYLLYCYRQERGGSPLCNFGRFHPRYWKSTNRKEGLRGGKLAEGHKDNPAGWPGIGPLECVGKPGDRDWMGLEWTAWEPLDAENVRQGAAGAGLYLLADAGSQEIVFIGQSADVAKRLSDHSRKAWDDRTLQFSYQIIGQSVLPHNLRELENDLIGNFFETGQVIGSGQGEESEGLSLICRKAPEYQFRNSTGR
jgi:hypothetical protein